ncbi:MAG: BrnT family toxin [Chloroflexia bacterium]
MTFYLEGIIWLQWIIDKIVDKHGVEPEEVEQCFANEPYKVRKIENDKLVFYRRADSGRYLLIIFVRKGQAAQVITARDMDSKERKYFSKK